MKSGRSRSNCLRYFEPPVSWRCDLSSPPHSLENPAGVRHHLFCLGLDLSRNSRGSARDAAVPHGWSAFYGGWLGALFVDEAHRGALAELARVAGGNHPGNVDVPHRLRLPVLGGTACPVRSSRS